ncbi:LolA family protein [Lunatimonas salinarum]|uniref:LolA family protein n=1 Tax=Lunatimonas salinarum TaxID=1774590 RepID=UPI001ADF67F2|nr:outer membrane lipoprotein carrier protein LolA [Lunatimonas salinarum]
MLKSVILLSFLTTAVMLDLLGQTDQRAQTILTEVSERYQELNGFKATFEYSYSTDTEGVIQTNTGEVSVKGDKYRLVLDDQEIYNDGNTVWTYIKSSKYEEVTINSVDKDSDELTPSNIYTIYQRGYASKLLGEKTMDRKPVYEILLTTDKKGSQFKEVKLYIEKNQKDLLAWEIKDDVGGIFLYKFKEVRKNELLPNEYFVFDLNANSKVEVIDLR